MQAVQLAIADQGCAAGLRDALARSGPWQVATTDAPDFGRKSVVVIDDGALDRIPLPLDNPERVVLITHMDAGHLARAWEAGIVSVVSCSDAASTILLAVMAAWLRVSKPQHTPQLGGGISPTAPGVSAPIPPTSGAAEPKRFKAN